ncbi:hypothetical protein GIB67_030583, partial [Kingdonia uniflora]
SMKQNEIDFTASPMVVKPIPLDFDAMSTPRKDKPSSNSTRNGGKEEFDSPSQVKKYKSGILQQSRSGCAKFSEKVTGELRVWVMRKVLFRLLCLCLFISILTVSTVEASKICRYKWAVKYEYKAQDCFKKLVITINGKTPGPSILAQQGDTVIVELKNGLLTEKVAIHWHGIRQIGTPWSDRTEGLTQCPITPRDTFVYQFVVDRLYHAHYGMQREAGLYGFIRASVPDGVTDPFLSNYDRSIILNDWYHKTPFEQATRLSSIPFQIVGEPQSLLIQGKVKFNCPGLTYPSLEPDVCNATLPKCSPYLLIVIPGKTYRLRIASLTSLSALNFEIELTFIAP